MKHKRKVIAEPALVAAGRREWRLLRLFPDYEISNDGRLRRATAGSNTKVGATIRVGMSRGKNAYPKYGLTDRVTRKRIFRNAHQLVAAEFLDYPPDGCTMVLHKDDNRLNCVDTNLKWGDGKENRSDAKRNNRLALGNDHPCRKKPWTRPRGENHTSSKLTDQDVICILKDTRLHREIAAAYGVDKALVGRIRQGKVWKHITNPEYRVMLEGRHDA